ncbi:hypothetical protein PO234_23110, partial [Bacteroides ovatus]|nr:hypothetical protein [Bacteroides ovatus]
LGNNKAPACESRGFVRKKQKVCILTHLPNNKGAIPVTGRNRRLASPSGNVQGYRWQLTRHAAPRNAGQSSPYTPDPCNHSRTGSPHGAAGRTLPGWRRLSDRHPANDKSVSYR